MPGYVLCSNPVNAGRSLYNSEPSIEKPPRNSPTRRCNPEIPGAIEDLARESATRGSSITARRLGTTRRAAAAPYGVERPLSLRVPDTRSSTSRGLAGRVAGYVPKSPCATSLNPGLGSAKSLQTCIVCPRRTSLRRSTWPDYARALGTLSEVMKRRDHARSADPRPRPIPEKQAPDPDLGRRAPRPPTDGPARR